MEGYAKVAHLMGTHSEFAIFRRFKALNMQNLLYLQAEITHLEAELHKIVGEDVEHSSRRYHAHDWWSLAHGEFEGDTDQWETVLEIREKLDKYNDTLLKQVAISQLQNPTEHDLELLRSWFERPGMGAFPLLGLDRSSWSKDHEKDLAAIMPRENSDPFAKWFSEKAIPVFHHLIGNKYKSPVSESLGQGLYEYKETAMQKVARVTTTVVASVLPLCSVIILYVVQSNAVRLGIIVALSALFSLALALMTNSRKIEIFAATSAFAAVNVVYLTNGTSSLSS